MKIDLTTGSLPKLIITLAIPALGSMFSDTLFHLINAFWIGKLGYKALAAQTASAFVIWMVFTCTSLITVGATAIIARRIGEKKIDIAQKTTLQALVISIYLSIIIGFVLILTTNYIMDFIQAEPVVTILTKEFLIVYIIGVPSIFLFMTIDAIFKAYGDTKTPMWILTLSLFINACLDPVLIFVLDLGFKGAAFATIIARLAGIIYGLLALKKKIMLNMPSHSINALWQIDFKLALQFIKIGLPPMLSGILFCLVYIVLAKIINIFGAQALAAIGIGHRIESISFCTFMALSVATTTLVGQNIGAKQIQRAEKAVHYAYLIGIALSCIIAIIFLVLPEKIILIMTSDRAVIETGALYLRITSASLIFMALELITQGGFNGAGNTLPPMFFNILFTLIRIPLAYYLAIYLNMRIAGVWWAINISAILKGISLFLWFKQGYWKEKKI